MSTEHHIIPFLFEAKWGYKDNEGNVVVEPLLDYADDFYEGFAIVRNDNGLYARNDSLNMINPFKRTNVVAI